MIKIKIKEGNEQVFDAEAVKKIFKTTGQIKTSEAINLKKTNAAVLIPLLVQEKGLTVLFTKRAGTMGHHAGQISFPGGHIENVDTSYEKTALREAYEEIGLMAEQTEILGVLEIYAAFSGLLIAPVVALVHPPFDFKASPAEVEKIFEVPLDYLVSKNNWKNRSFKSFTGGEIFSQSLEYDGELIWGITADIIRQFRQRLIKHA